MRILLSRVFTHRNISIEKTVGDRYIKMDQYEVTT